MTTHKSFFPHLTLLLLFTATIVVTSSQTSSTQAEPLKEAHKKTSQLKSLIEAIPGLLDGKVPAGHSEPCPNCGSCLLSLSNSIIGKHNFIDLSVEEINNRIKKQYVELVARQHEDDNIDVEQECQNVRRQIEIKQLEKALKQRVAIEQQHTINRLEKELKAALYNLSIANAALMACKERDIVCPICPIPQPCPTPQPCPPPPQVNCQAFQQENKNLKSQLLQSQADLKSANATINGYKNSSNSWNKLIGQTIKKVNTQTSQKISAKDASKVNLSGITRVLEGIEKSSTSQNATSKTQQQLLTDLSGEFISFIDNQVNTLTQAQQNKDKCLAKFKDVLENLKDCNEQIKKIYSVKK